MKLTVAKIALGPLLLMQGLYTRRVTPQLPEPEGERGGILGHGPRLRLLIVGDSAAAGVGVSHQREALSGQLVSMLAERGQVQWTLLARSGFSTQEVLHMLAQHPRQQFDVAVVSVGVNDVTSNISVDQWVSQQRQLQAVLTQQFGTAHIILSPVPPMHLFPALPQPLRWYLGSRARHFNTELRRIHAPHEPCTVLDSPLPVRTDWMAQDGFHPGAPLYETWARQLVEVIGRVHSLGAGLHRQIDPEG